FDLTGRKSRTAGLLCLFPTGRVPFRGLLGIAHSFANAHVQMPKLVVRIVPLDLELFERRIDAFHSFFQVFDPFLCASEAEHGKLPGEAACRAPFTVLALRSPPCLAGFTPALRGTLAGQTRLAHPRGELLGLATYPGLPTLHFKWTRVKTIKKRNPQDFHSH